jgi:hypothetical protein
MNNEWQRFGLEGPYEYTFEDIEGNFYKTRDTQSIKWKDEDGSAKFKIAVHNANVANSYDEKIFTSVLTWAQIRKLLYLRVTDLTTEGLERQIAVLEKQDQLIRGHLDILSKSRQPSKALPICHS